METVALHRRGWSISAIARHTGRDRKTVRAWLRGERARRPRAPSVLEPFRDYVARSFEDDRHLDATVPLRELRPLGFERSYPTLTRELRRLGLRLECPACKRGGHRLTVELAHEADEELQLGWLELEETPRGEQAHALAGGLSHSGRIRAVLAEGQSFPEPPARSTVCAPPRRHRPQLADRPDGGDRGHGVGATSSSVRRAYGGFGCTGCGRVCGWVDNDGRCQTCGPLTVWKPELSESERSLAALQREYDIAQRIRRDRL